MTARPIIPESANTVANGKTGATTFTVGAILFGNGTSALATDSGFTFDSVYGYLTVQNITAPTTLDLIITGCESISEYGGRVVAYGANGSTGGGSLEFGGGHSFTSYGQGGSYTFSAGYGTAGNGRGLFFDGLGNRAIVIQDDLTNTQIGFFDATPVAQQVAATDLGTALANLGLRTAGGYPITATTIKATTNYQSSDGSNGYTGTVTAASLAGKTLTIKNGLITGFA